MTRKINGNLCHDVLYQHGCVMTAADIAFCLNTDSRAVATALRKPVEDGRVKIVEFSGGIAHYEFKQHTPKRKGSAA